MRMRPSQSFAVKLTAMITVVSGLAAAVVCAALVVLEVSRVERTAVETAGAHARVIAANCTAALDFDDEEAATDTLAGLAAVSEFAAAEVRKPDGSVFARYRRAGARNLPELIVGDEPVVSGAWLVMPQPIVRDREVIGNLTILYDMTSVRRRLISDIGVTTAITLLVIVLAYFGALRLQRLLLRPVRELSEAAETIATTDDYNVRARKYSDDELGVLTDVFNTMIGRIKEAEAMRRDHQAMLEREVAARTAEVLDTQARLRQSERMASLGTLSAGLGHDIGNILMPLRAHLSSIRDKAGRAIGDSEDLERDFTAIGKTTEYLQHLSAGLRLLAKDPESAQLSESTDLAEWWSVTEPLLRAIVGSRIRLDHDLPDELPGLRIPRHLLTQAVLNLVQNAANALVPEDGRPPSAGFIRVEAAVVTEPDGAPRVRVSVVDNGPGMTDEVRRRCIEPYFTTGVRRISSGLGLPLVKGIVERVGGTLDFETRLGKGSTFTLTIPAEPPRSAEARERSPSAVVTISEPRRKAMVAHVLRSLNCRVHSGAPAEAAAGGLPNEGLWVTDSAQAVPGGWRGRVVVFGDSSSPSPDRTDRYTVVDASTSLPALRRVLQEFLSGNGR